MLSIVRPPVALAQLLRLFHVEVGGPLMPPRRIILALDVLVEGFLGGPRPVLPAAVPPPEIPASGSPQHPPIMKSTLPSVTDRCDTARRAHEDRACNGAHEDQL